MSAYKLFIPLLLSLSLFNFVLYLFIKFTKNTNKTENMNKNNQLIQIKKIKIKQ